MKETVISIEKRRVVGGVLVSDTRSGIDMAANAASKRYVLKLCSISDNVPFYEADTTLDASTRRRGRPSGKNRSPLSLTERRARNALYERQRRQVTSEAIADLAVAAGCDPSLSSADILATVINQLQAAEHTANEIKDIKYVNAKLMEQIATLEKRLNDEEEEITDVNINKKRKIESELRENSFDNQMTGTEPQQLGDH